jgi:hypothetical protein
LETVFVVAGYAVFFALVCMVLKVPLVENPNRTGAFPPLAALAI